ncbi:hypothetical protein COCC4DRAFT_130594 [Bipolaris maydis ATCC 48331]|uniref:Stc1 domain-containing protein n=1 Tax=Cochliobolus heterostrophus (strain C4 / ATCC 48331 / race T) TaxID=665024 RepID=N4XNP6_COCH4|nr:uncharacterized protein COCC4DRAFT_130594 [Bipolaris maydis ATCC 48331]KAH7550880.1 hypothetical protein BM1_10253 [Bipolaris maydis]ENI07951.1 hypothetical protein COCC4DRAFT_130594 [Bipolaris maydis ATCC 48331]KAJ5022110.1 hypothetical protein J3E73DRAFT_374372 [Bipolaris maydis]KAJ6272391.1 hypothetical protein PSV08DRAFT_350528 [Bipolaris maydis]KAJ6281518.1 hypothetical protein J3E71DRAFT_342232 [Bipolaris maydis]
MHFLKLLALTLFITLNFFFKDKQHYHTRPVGEQQRCIDFCYRAGRSDVLHMKMACASCMERIHNSVCYDCAKARYLALPYKDEYQRCWRCYKYAGWNT